jgi:tRNA pseudouridine32 synthase/23S rRNA pseudouridine746 synthase
MATSGLMLLARGAAAQRSLSMAFEAREVHKRYIAVVAGLVEGESGAIDLPLAADWPRRPLQKIDRVAGKPALTRWRIMVRDRAGQQTRLELEPVTGRTHQLRVHLLTIGHPIIGDRLYAPDDANPAAPRLLLHASRLDLRHPATGASLSFDCPPPF